jgi:hypothetical protein
MKMKREGEKNLLVAREMDNVSQAFFLVQFVQSHLIVVVVMLTGGGGAPLLSLSVGSEQAHVHRPLAAPSQKAKVKSQTSEFP